MPWRKIVYVLFFISLFLGVLVFFASQQSKTYKRDVPSLLDFYYLKKKSEPWEAKDALQLIIEQNPKNTIANRELAFWYLNRGDTRSALKFLKQSHQRLPNDPVISYELAKLFLMFHQPEKARALLSDMINSEDIEYRKKALELLGASPEPTPKVVKKTVTSYVTPIYFNETPVLTPLFQRAEAAMKADPRQAREYLHLILSLDPNSDSAYQKLGFLELGLGHEKQAAQYFIQAFKLKPTATIALQIGYILAKNKQIKRAELYFHYTQHQGDKMQKLQAAHALKYITRLAQMGALGAGGVPVLLSKKDKMLNLFYENKEKNPAKAWRAIHQLLRWYPGDIRMWKEAAYFAVSQKKWQKSLFYWHHIYAQEKKSEYALQIANIYNSLGNRSKSFQYFSRAAKTSDLDLKYKAEIAMTNLGGAHTKILPDPYFIEMYTAPFYFSRFDLGVLPTIIRAGVNVNKTYDTDVYLSYRRTSDSRSGTIDRSFIQAPISQIFEDNVAIYAIGARTRFWPEGHLQGFIEIGRAQDLIFRNRPMWDDDVRGGFVYYNAWGAKPTYTFNFNFPLKPVATLYSDIIYYSRYDNNIISASWFRPGLRLATYQSSSLDVYVANYLILDKNKEFFNNVYSIGPGIVFQPSNRLNLKIRYESLQGYYIPVNSPSPNPYRSRYYNNIVLLEGYIKF